MAQVITSLVIKGEKIEELTYGSISFEEVIGKFFSYTSFPQTWKRVSVIHEKVYALKKKKNT